MTRAQSRGRLESWAPNLSSVSVTPWRHVIFFLGTCFLLSTMLSSILLNYFTQFPSIFHRTQNKLKWILNKGSILQKRYCRLWRNPGFFLKSTDHRKWAFKMLPSQAVVLVFRGGQAYIPSHRYGWSAWSAFLPSWLIYTHIPAMAYSSHDAFRRKIPLDSQTRLSREENAYWIPFPIQTNLTSMRLSDLLEFKTIKKGRFQM